MVNKLQIQLEALFISLSVITVNELNQGIAFLGGVIGLVHLIYKFSNDIKKNKKK